MICYTCRIRESSDKLNKFGKPSKQCDECRIFRATRYKKFDRPRQQKLKQEAINAYGGVCGCCKESEPIFLTVDHIDNDGAKHRKEIGRGNYGIYKWLKDNNYPSNFRILCFNCNSGRDINGGVCPHEQKRLDALEA